MKTQGIIHNERGVTAMTAAITLLGVMSLSAFVIDLGNVYVTQQELRNVADSAALAASRQMAEILSTKSTAELQDSSFTLSSSEMAQVVTAAANVAVLNKAGGHNITLNTASSDVSIGAWDSATGSFGPVVPGTIPDAVQIVARRDAANNGAVNAFFAQMLGVSTFDLSANATAALLPVGAVPPGGIGLPIGISDEVFAAGACGDAIKMYPTGTIDACAGWHTFGENANANNLNDIIDDLNNGSGGILPGGQSPAVQVGDSVNFVGGTISSALQSFQELYDAKQVGGVMEGVVIVYDGAPGCPNPNTALPVAGFAKVKITEVKTTGNPKEIKGEIQCEVIDGRPSSGGIDTLTRSKFPVLVS